jgi:predicted CopG family antitoxin
MTISDIVEKLFSFYQGKSIDLKVVQRFLRDNKVRVTEEVQMQILDAYNRRLIEWHMKHGNDIFSEDHMSYVEARKKLDFILAGVSAKLSTDDLVELKQQVNNVINCAILWSRK